ncbi:AAA family ATPase [Sulfitobacter sp. 1A13679]|uniref:AAA family ATPase n=1 Tax=Sulfitobacter sp. 1A13679 TaxID=3368597 RepID=UPI0037467A74
MKVLTVFTSKGGSGKSTLAIHMAVLASQQKRGNSVLMLDYDVQESSTFWTRIRESDNPPVLPADPGSFSGYLEQAEEEGINLVVVDMPPHSATQADLVLSRSDLVLVPVRPGALDIWALETTVKAINDNHARGVFVLNQVPARGTEADETEEVLTEIAPQIPVAKSRLGYRKPFSSALNAGLAITEFASPREKAAQEAAALFAEIKRMLK